MVHKNGDLGYPYHVPRVEKLEMITVGQDDAKLLKVFLYSQEKEALKAFAAKQGVPMYHLVRGLILELLEQQQQDKLA
jgi:hypothetical protein